jgi:hypothetical protein
MIRTLFAALLIGAALACPALADDDPGEPQDGRFMFKRVEEGFIRLDTRTGQVSLCSRHTVGWACQPMPEERAALEAEIARLQTENAVLKKELLAHGLDLPGGVKPDKPPARGSDRDSGLPSDTDLDRVMALLEKAWRRLVDLMATLHRG